MKEILPKNIEKRLTSRAKNVLLTAYQLERVISGPKNKMRTQYLHILFALSKEEGSLSKNILQFHKITAKRIASAIGLSGYKARSLQKTSAPENASRGSTDFCEQTKSLIKKAMSIAARQNQPYIGTEHLLYALVSSIPKTKGSVSKKTLKTRILPENKASQIKSHLDKIFSQSMPLLNFPYLPKNAGGKTPLEFLTEIDNIPRDINFLHQTNLKKTDHANFEEDGAKSAFNNADDSHTHRHDKDSDHDKSSVKKRPDKKNRGVSALDAFCENLTLMAEQGKLDPVVGRKNEINRIINIITKRTKNNPLLIGEPGVGKTAIVQGLAQKIAQGDVPETLADKQVFSLNLNSLVAGTMFRGDFEARIQEIISEASNRKIILFIDEVHTVIGTGSATGTLDAANILKPALSTRKLQCIGATTLEEYRKYIEKERALERRFQAVYIKEELEDESVLTLSNLKKLYEQHHRITITDDAIKAAVELSSRYIKDRFLPDKAIDVLDEAASRLRASVSSNKHTKKLRELERIKAVLASKKEAAIIDENYKDALIFRHQEEMAAKEINTLKKNFQVEKETPALTRRNIEEIIEETTGIPLPKNEDGFYSLNNLKRFLCEEIVGQEKAVLEVISTLKRNKVGLSDKKRPIGSFLFAGPSGVGKTALAKALADGQSQNLIKIDMSEFSESYSMSRLIGSPPGYVGYDEGGELTEKIRRNPYSVVLFDEIDKAHPQVHNILLSILDDGTAKDAQGRDVSFRNSIIILTSNVNSDNFQNSKKTLGFIEKRPQDSETGKYEEYLKSVLRKEVTNRVDRIIEFNDLGKNHIEQIVRLALSKLSENLSKNGFHIKISGRVPDFLAEKAYKSGEGARLVRTTVEKFVENPLAEYLIKNTGSKKITIEATSAKIYVKEL